MDALFVWAGRRPYAMLSALLALCVAVFLASIPLPRVDSLLIGSDGVRYYEYTRSLVIDSDLDFTNERQHFNAVSGRTDRVPLTALGRPVNRHSVGVGLLWIPFFLTAHVVATFLGLTADGYGYLYQAAICLGSLGYGFLGVLLVYRLCREQVDAASALCAVVVMWFGSNVVYYMVAEPSMSHSLSFAAVSALLAWWRLYPARESVRYWGGLGVLGAVAAMVRPQDALFALLPGIEWIVRGVPLVRARRWKQAIRHGLPGAVMAGAFAAVFAIQLRAWLAVFGSLGDSGYFHGGLNVFPDWRRPLIAKVLFSLEHGFFTWHPVYLVGAVGLWWVVRRERLYGLLLAAGCAAQVVTIAARDFWAQGDAFGGRVLICTAPALTIGLAEVVQRLRCVSARAVILAGVALVWWNVSFMVQYRFGFIPMKGPITVRQLVTEKFTLPFDAWQRRRHGGR